MTAVSTVHMYFRWTSQPTTTLRNAQGPPGEGQLHKDTASPWTSWPPRPLSGWGRPDARARVRWLLRSTSDKEKDTHCDLCPLTEVCLSTVRDLTGLTGIC